ncbi:MAG TPA: RNase adapter RapZ [Thermoanaerobaculia bacterium]|nr:RNase adapter RapZ [Thermoanaerobaculia bacterium]
MSPEYLVVITGLSGAGKSYAHSTLEDLGFYCTDNLPVHMIDSLIEHVTREGYTRIGIVVDVRTPGFAEDFPTIYRERIKRANPEAMLIFLEASNEVLARRFSETRRPHPYDPELPMTEAIESERRTLDDVKAMADMVLDTSQFSVHELKAEVIRRFGLSGYEREMLINIVTFGYKYVLPYNLDLMFDVRFLPNPHFVDELRPKTGLDLEIIEYLEAQPEYREFVDRLSDFLLYVVPRYEKEMKSYLTIGIGCTGGRHRSVAVGERLRRALGDAGYSVEVTHRDCNR